MNHAQRHIQRFWHFHVSETLPVSLLCMLVCPRGSVLHKSSLEFCYASANNRSVRASAAFERPMDDTLQKTSESTVGEQSV